jgi:hypothetical protein
VCGGPITSGVCECGALWASGFVRQLALSSFNVGSRREYKGTELIKLPDNKINKIANEIQNSRRQEKGLFCGRQESSGSFMQDAMDRALASAA